MDREIIYDNRLQDAKDAMRMLPMGVHIIAWGLFNAAITTPVLSRIFPEEVFEIWACVPVLLCIIGIIALLTELVIR